MVCVLQTIHWSELIASKEQDVDVVVTDGERRRREAVWEVFQSECVFLIDHLMVLKHVRHTLSHSTRSTSPSFCYHMSRGVVSAAVTCPAMLILVERVFVLVVVRSVSWSR